MKPAHPDRSASPLLVIGWDGATPELIGPWMADGTLPNLAALAKRGSFSPLRSLIHPLSPAAWTSAVTGLNPGRHGIWDFGHRVPGTYTVAHTDARSRHGATLWDIAGDCGLRSVVLNVPLSHPCESIEGVFVPGVGVDKLEGATVPAAAAEQIKQAVPGYVIDANAYEHRDPGEFLASVERMVETRTQVAESLIQRERPDLFFGVFVSTDRVQHAFWKQSDLPGGEDRSSWRFADAIKRSYQQLDAALGRLVAAAGPDPTVMVVSDHGFGDLEGDFYINTVLEEMGLLSVRRKPSFASGRVGRLARKFNMGSLLPDSDEELTFGDIHWEESRAYSRGLFGNVWLNLRGREPAGQVEPGVEAESLLDEITARLLSLRAPGGRELLLDAVFRGRDLFEGDQAEHAPDLVVVPREYRWMTRSGREISSRCELFSDAAIAHTGNHRMNGVLVAGGPGIQALDEPPLQRLLDLTPTALALLGIEVPRGLDGKPMQDLLTCDVGWTDELPWRDPPGGEPASPAQQEALADQLRGLGYLADEPAAAQVDSPAAGDST